MVIPLLANQDLTPMLSALPSILASLEIISRVVFLKTVYYREIVVVQYVESTPSISKEDENSMN